ncbi:MAG: NADH-quinone oxidoreductase subunit C [bacterium]|jgi:NADH-quinone oxidoreductase subunit C
MLPQVETSSFALQLRNILGKRIYAITHFRKEVTITVLKKDIVEVCELLKEHPTFLFQQLIDLTAVDYLGKNLSYRFCVVYHLLSFAANLRLRIKCELTEDDLTVPTLSYVWNSANWYERECFDLYGIQFQDHPNLKRILLYQEFQGFPLRKDYNINQEQPILKMLKPTINKPSTEIHDS